MRDIERTAQFACPLTRRELTRDVLGDAFLRIHADSLETRFMIAGFTTFIGEQLETSNDGRDGIFSGNSRQPMR
jgi:hypothetical protein